MTPFTEVSCDDIERLDQTQLVDLLRILLHSEAKKHGLIKHGVHVPAQITVADGGNDGEWDAASAPSEYIPRDFTIYQSKATSLEASGCVDELINKTRDPNDGRRKVEVLKSQVKKAADRKGAYVYFIRKGYTQQSLENRLDDSYTKLKEFGIDKSELELMFVDGNKIAMWANVHAAAIFFIKRSVSQICPFNVETYDYWAGHAEFKDAFESTTALDKIIQSLRSELLGSPVIARLTGLSGLGKTRLAFEIFRYKLSEDAEECRQIEALANSCVYWDAADGETEILSFFKQLNQLGVAGTLVIDNCSIKLHGKLQREVQHDSSQLSVLTLDFGEEREASGCLSLKLTRKMMEKVVPKMLKTATLEREDISDAQIEQISKFAQGFPRIARLMLDAGQALDWTDLNQDDLASRLVWGREEGDPNDFKFLEALSVFMTVGCSGDSAADLEFVCQEMCGAIHPDEFMDRVHQFSENQVLQKIGDFWQVTPAPLAVALAAKWLERKDDDYIERFFSKLEKTGLQNGFINRIRQLDFSERAQELSERWLGESGPFGSAKVLNSETGSRVFRALAELNPSAALSCLDRELGDYSPDEAKQFLTGRRNVLWALEKLCWLEEEFPVGAKVLLILASGEVEEFSNSATETFCGLYHIHLSGTQYPAIDRLQLIESGLESEFQEVNLVCIKALGEAFSWDRFMRSGGREARGTKSLGQDWQPRNWDEVYEYWKRCFTILKELVLKADKVLADAAKASLCKGVRTVSNFPLMRELQADFEKVVTHLGNFWPCARDELKQRLSFDREKMDTKHVDLLESWLGMLTPLNLEAQLVDLVCKPGWHHEDQKDGTFIDLSKEGAEALAREFIGTGDNWKIHLDVLLEGDQQQTAEFARVWMEHEPNKVEFIEEVLEAYRAIDIDSRNYSLIRGLMVAVKGSELCAKVLEQLAGDVELRLGLLPSLTQLCAEGIDDFQRIFDLVVDGNLPDSAIHTIGFSNALFDLDGVELQKRLFELIGKSPVAKPQVFYLLSQYYRRSAERLAQVRPLVENLLTSKEVIRAKNIQLIDYQWKEAVTVTLNNNPHDSFVEQLTGTLVDILVEEGRVISGYTDTHIVSIVRLLLKNHGRIAWPLFESALRDEDGELRYFVADFLARGGVHDESGAALWEVSPDQFRVWAKTNVDLLPFFLSNMPLYLVEKAEEPETDVGDGDPEVAKLAKLVSPGFMREFEPGDKFVWHPLAEVLLEFTYEQDLLGSLRCNLFSFGSTGSRVPYLENRLLLLQDLVKNTDRPELKKVARRVAEDLSSEIEKEKKRDVHREIGRGL